MVFQTFQEIIRRHKVKSARRGVCQILAVVNIGFRCNYIVHVEIMELRDEAQRRSTHDTIFP